MEITRRKFLRTLLAAGGTILLTAGGKRDILRNDYGGPDAEAPASGTRTTDSGEVWKPAYRKLEEEGKLAERIEEAYSILENCTLCPRKCGVNRLDGGKGFCGTTSRAVVYSGQPHFGEEVPLVGRHGSGTIFFSNCNLRCVFCQNWPIAHEGRGSRTTDDELAGMMLDLQAIGCHNINLVTPTHVMPNILRALRIAMHRGLHIPLCWNTGGYEEVENVRLLDGIVDIYLPDLKFMDGEEAHTYAAAARDYPMQAQRAIIEMHRQVGDLVTDSRGIALRGLLVRHLVMPYHVAGTREFVTWAASNLSTSTYINIMAQYRVAHRAFEYPKISRAITAGEFLEAIEWAKEAGLSNLDERSLSQAESLRRRL